MGIGSTWENFFDKQAKNNTSTAKFIERPVTPEVFFRDWMGQPLFPEQLLPINAMFTPDLEDLNPELNELLLMWGEGSGKDFLCERILIYVAYWLLCLRSPQKYLGRAEGTPIDLVNTSVNEEHASNVFFEQFCQAINLVINPDTGKNWFEERGMDIRSGRDILTSKVKFPKNISAYSCNSIKYTAEGKNVLIGILDEIAEFKYDKAKALYTNLKATATSRFPVRHKLILISYLRDEFDFMNSHWNEVEAMPASLRDKVYMSKKATWEINQTVTKLDYADAYEKDPEDSARRYENIMPSKKGAKFIKDGMRITNAVYDFEGSPIISETPYISTNLNAEIFQVWFRAYYIKEIYRLEQEFALTPTAELRLKIDGLKEMHSNGSYYIHIDLSKGAYDYAGLCLLHTYQKTETQIGYYVDLIVQLQPDGNEINFEQIREFIFKLQSQGFPIAKVSLDGWNCQFGTNTIKMLDGTTKQIKEITKEEWIYSFDIKSNKIVPALCKPARLTGEGVGGYEVQLDNGEKATFTAEHKILMLNGTYKRVLDLRPGDQIRPLELRTKSIWGGTVPYLQVHQPTNKTKKWQFVHRMVAINCIKTPTKEEVIHHSDFNSFNNTPTNLQVIMKRAHAHLHHTLCLRNGPKISAALKGQPKHALHGERVSKGVLLQWKNRSMEELTSLKVKISKTVSSLWKNEEYKKHMSEAHKGYHWKLVQGRRIFYRNHRIISIKYVGKENVYDLEVPIYHNVGLSCGIFAHNSVDFMQLLDKRGITVELVSMDRTMQPYNTLKDVLYQEILEYYYNPILLRELNELQVINGKVDHPKESPERLKEEGKRLGSKDLADALAGATFCAVSAGGSGNGCIVELGSSEPDDLLDKFF